MTLSAATRVAVGIDTGGTFTDFVLLAEGRLQVHKVLSTPAAPEIAILQGLRELGVLDHPALTLVHGSTVATNAVLEGKGVTTLYLTNAGFEDLLTIGRQARRDLYDLQPHSPPEPVPSSHCLGIESGRLTSAGRALTPLDEAELATLSERIADLDPPPQAVAINLLFSYLDPSLEARLAAALPRHLFVSRGAQILPQQGEYERGIACWLNSSVGPLVDGYLSRLTSACGGAHITVMQSSGDTIAAPLAAAEAVRMLLSGPAGGLAGARYIAAAIGEQQLLTFDMGGTSTDVALIDGELQLTSEGQMGGWPVAVPQVDMHTIGAGGGSIAWIDGGGLLQVGPRSAGAQPGPACYGAGGEAATVTDANLLLGRLQPDAFLGGAMALDVAAARTALDRLGAQLQLTAEQVAAGIIAIANEHMARALRVMSLQRGIDPRPLLLVPFGGAGGLHVCALADALGIRRALLPIHAGVLSAFGMLAARRGRQLVQALSGELLALPLAVIEAGFAQLEAAGREALIAEGVAAPALQLQRRVDLRYRGQSSTLTLAWQGIEATATAFHQRHCERYGHTLEQPLELVNLRLTLQGAAPQLPLSALPQAGGDTPLQPQRWLQLADQTEPVALWQRMDLVAGMRLRGPALIVESVASCWLAPEWEARVDEVGNLVLSRQEGVPH